jgi:hypothetical protein
VTEECSGAATAFAAALARSRGWRLALCPLPLDHAAGEQLGVLVAAASREDAALAVVPRSDEPGWADAFFEASLTAPCPLIAIPRDAEPGRSGEFVQPEREAQWA